MRKRYVYDKGHDKMVEVSEDFRPESRSDYHIMPDIKPYRSMIDGREITSRSRHREHLREHGCEEIGNDSSLWKPRKPLESPPGLKEKIIRAVNEVEEAQRRRKCR